MPTFRISLAALLTIIAVVAIGLAGMTSASRFWTAAAATVTLALLLAALLAACLLAGRDRAFWMGFALFGWAYLALVNWDWIGGQFGHDLTAGLNEVAEALFPTSPAQGSPYEVLARRQMRFGNFVQIGRMLLSLLFALLGGVSSPERCLSGGERGERHRRPGRPGRVGIIERVPVP